jgi:hypothetical protein
MEITRISDDELRQLAIDQGPLSPPANILHRLREKRAKDRQVFAWQVGEYCFIGPAPDAETEMAMIDLAESNDDEYEVEV